VNGLASELARVGISGRLARRIELELDDHLRCDPAANLGALGHQPKPPSVQ